MAVISRVVAVSAFACAACGGAGTSGGGHATADSTVTLVLADVLASADEIANSATDSTASAGDAASEVSEVAEDSVAAEESAGADSDDPDGFFDPPDAAKDGTSGDVQSGSTAPPWLLSIDNAARKLLKVDLVTGKTAPICTIPNKFSYPSLTFRRDNVLMASRKGAALDQIDPCTCAVTPIGIYGAATGVNGITSNHANGLFGISAGLESLISINPSTGAATAIGKLGVQFGANGATWSDAIQALYAINGSDDTLYVVDPKTGVASYQAKLSKNFTSVGVERHPGNGQIYACSDDANLLKVDPLTGNVSIIGNLGETGGCTNLAAPWGPLKCIDEVKIP